MAPVSLPPLSSAPTRLHRRLFLCSSRVSAAPPADSVGIPTSTSIPKVVVTRERGKNGKLISALAEHEINGLELPLVEHRCGPHLGAVGTGTASIFREDLQSSKPSLDVAFSPSKATGKVLATELPKKGSKCTVLYPASAKASKEIEEGLSNHGFEVTRMDTYTKVPVRHIDQMVLKKALSVPVVAVASPSAVRI